MKAIVCCMLFMCTSCSTPRPIPLAVGSMRLWPKTHINRTDEVFDCKLGIGNLTFMEAEPSTNEATPLRARDLEVELDTPPDSLILVATILADTWAVDAFLDPGAVTNRYIMHRAGVYYRTELDMDDWIDDAMFCPYLSGTKNVHLPGGRVARWKEWDKEGRSQTEN
jgi:hypothetical protein